MFTKLWCGENKYRVQPQIQSWSCLQWSWIENISDYNEFMWPKEHVKMKCLQVRVSCVLTVNKSSPTGGATQPEVTVHSLQHVVDYWRDQTNYVKDWGDRVVQCFILKVMLSVNFSPLFSRSIKSVTFELLIYRFDLCAIYRLITILCALDIPICNFDTIKTIDCQMYSFFL